MRKQTKYLIFSGTLVIIILLYGFTYIPYKVVKIDSSKISSIVIFDGNTGYETEISDKVTIQYIIENLNGITFQKDKWAAFSMGYGFRTTINNDRGKAIKKLIINSSNTIRYRGFFYKARQGEIDYEYIKKVIEALPDKGL
jgi:hypothetical protein